MAKTDKTLRRTPEITALRIALLQRGWSVSDLASRCKFAPGRMAVELSASCPSLKNRCRIERATGMVLWSSHAEFARRSRIFERLAVDPGFHDLRELLAAAQCAGIDVIGARKEKAKLIRRLEEYFAANPTRSKPTTP